MILYEPAFNHNHTDTFEYTIIDCAGNSDSAIVTLNINTRKEESDNGTSLGTISMILMMLLTSMLGLFFIRKET